MSLPLPKIEGYSLKWCEPASHGSESANVEIKHSATGRQFNIRVLEGTYTAEVLLSPGSARRAADGTRFFAEEFQPNGRIGASTPKCWCAYAEDVSGYKAVEDIPSKAIPFIEEAANAKTPYQGEYPFWAVYCGSGYGTHSIYYESLEQALKAITNAVDADMWLTSDEPVREKVDPGTGAKGSHEIWSLIHQYNCWEQLEAILTEVKGSLQTGHRIQIAHWTDSCCYIEVLDDSQEYPANMRLGLTFDMESQSLRRDKGICFYRSGYASIAQRFLGAAAKCYG